MSSASSTVDDDDEFCLQSPRGKYPILEIPEIPYSTVWDRWKEASAPKISSIHPFVSIQYRLVTHGRTDGHKTTANTAPAQRRAVNILAAWDATTSVRCVCYVCVACNGSDVMRCANTDRCIHTSYVCDGHDTCGDWTDELNCSQSAFSPLIYCAVRTVLLTAAFQPRPICRLTYNTYSDFIVFKLLKSNDADSTYS